MTATNDESIFLHAYRLDARPKARALSDAEVAAFSHDEGLLWLHLDVNDEKAREWLFDESGIDELSVEALLAEETRPRAVGTDEGLLIILRGVNMNPGAEPEDMVSIRIWLEPHRIITTRRRLLESLQDVRRSAEQGHGPRTPGAFLVQFIERLAERIGTVIESIDDTIDEIEATVERGGGADLYPRLGVLRRQTASIRRYLAPQRDALQRLPTTPGLLTREESHELRELSDRTMRLLEDLELLRERAIVAQEELMNRLARDQNSRLYVLSIVAAVFLPLSFVTGLLGMNVAGLPGTDDPNAFGVSLLVMGGCAVALLGYFRWRKWI